MPGKIDSFGLSDIGKVREVNEDQFLIADLNKSLLIHQTSLNHEDHSRLFGASQGQLFLVADGMGGHAAGKRASTIAVNSLAESVLNTLSWSLGLGGNQETILEQELQAAMERCQRQIEACASATAETHGMGTTLTMAYLLWPRLYVVHAGDSRCYLLRDNQLGQITTDQTMAQKLVEQGALQPAEAQQSRWSHVLWSCLGGGNEWLRTEIYKCTLTYGDTLLLCTDGLTSCIGDQQIRTLLSGTERAQDCCRQLIHAANEAGGPDNITVVVVRLAHTQQPVAEARQQAAVSEESVNAPGVPVPLFLRWPGLGKTAMPARGMRTPSFNQQ